MNKVKKIAIALLVLLVIVPTTMHANTTTYLKEIKEIIKTSYYGDIPAGLEDMTTIEEVVSALDNYSKYMTDGEYKNYVSAVGAEESTLAAMNRQQNANVTSMRLNEDVAYIHVKTFSATMDNEVLAHYLKLRKEGSEKLILDLRDNGGGYVDSAERLLGHFTGVKTAYKMNTKEQKRTVKTATSKFKFPQDTYVLVNRNSASASEIVAASLQDQNAAIIVGERTKGKGTIQSFFEFEDGSALKLTIGEFTGPHEKTIHQAGVTPTILANSGEELDIALQQLADKKKKEEALLVQKSSLLKVWDIARFKDIQMTGNMEDKRFTQFDVKKHPDIY